jgi:hypothetical protein
MPVWPKIVYTYHVSLRTAATKWKLRQVDCAPAQQEHVFDVLTRRLAATSYWKMAGIEPAMSYSQFQARVPVHTHEQIAPAIEQMMRGECDVLWPGRCTLFAQTSGTSSGEPRFLPVTDYMLRLFRRSGFESLLYYTVRARHAGAFRGRHLLYGGTTALTPLHNGNPPAGFAGSVTGIAALNLPKWVERHYYEPGPTVAQMPVSDAQNEAIASRTRARDITLIAGVPQGVTLLADALRATNTSGHNPGASLKAHWPNLECLTHGGAPIAPYAAELRRVLGPDVAFHEVYAATEGFIATQDVNDEPGLRLMTDLGLFFEFVPLSDYDDSRVEQLGSKAVSCADVKTGINYVVLVTTPGGLARHVLGDVVRFTSLKPPRPSRRPKDFAYFLLVRPVTASRNCRCDPAHVSQFPGNVHHL